MSKYLVLDTGKKTTGDDPRRMIWYATASRCGYWTDDLSKLGRFNNTLPVCPKCGCPGFQTTAEKWFAVDKSFELQHQGYTKWLPLSKEVCSKVSGLSFLDRFKKYKNE